MDQDLPSLDLERRALRRVRLKSGFAIHALVFVLVNAALALPALIGDGGGRGSAFRLWGWGLGLAIHGLVVLIRLNGEGLQRSLVQKEIEHLRRREGPQR